MHFVHSRSAETEILAGLYRRDLRKPLELRTLNEIVAFTQQQANSSIACAQRPAKMKSILSSIVALSTLFTSSQALYFYLDGTTPKCFYEDLPKDTLVVGMQRSLPQPGDMAGF